MTLNADLKKAAQKAISLLDLTNLNADCTPDDIADLCKKAQTEFGNTAAICIWKEHIQQAKALLEHTNIQIATVVNFPEGNANIKTVNDQIEQAIGDGADEIDLVLPYKAFLQGDEEKASTLVKMASKACNERALLKVILETGELGKKKHIKRASHLAINAGADFIKTSTGKVPVNATLKSSKIMLKAIRKSGKNIGFKPAGGIKTTQDAADYLELAAKIMGRHWAKPATLRFGASGVLADLLSTLKDEKQSPSPTGY